MPGTRLAGLAGALLLLNSLLLFSCSNRSEQATEGGGDGPQVHWLKIHRYEQALFNIRHDSLAEGLVKLSGEYAFFIGDNYRDETKVEGLRAYLNDPLVNRLYRDASLKFKDLSGLEKSLGSAFQNYSAAFPGRRIPVVYTYISGLDYESPVRLVDSVMIIALDMFLGNDVPYYREMGIPAYLSRRFSPEYITVNCMETMAGRHNGRQEEQKTLLDWMIREGKALYFLDVMLPEVPDSLKIAYTAAQLDWCVENEDHIWAFLISNKLLFSSQRKDIEKFIGDSPFTKGFPDQSPGRLGCWLGWQIVRKFMSKKNNLSAEQLFAMKDSQEILRESAYKPGK